jgi:hypothetical protein
MTFNPQDAVLALCTAGEIQRDLLRQDPGNQGIRQELDQTRHMLRMVMSGSGQQLDPPTLERALDLLGR